VAQALDLLVHHPSEFAQAGQVGLTVLLGGDGVLAVEKVRRRLIGPAYLADHIGAVAGRIGEAPIAPFTGLEIVEHAVVVHRRHAAERLAVDLAQSRELSGGFALAPFDLSQGGVVQLEFRPGAGALVEA